MCVCYLVSRCVCDVCACHVIFMYMKEGAGGSRWEGKDGVVVLCVCSMCVHVCVSYEGRGQRELVDMKTGYDIVCC